MKSIKRIPAALSKWISPTFRVLLVICILLATYILTASPPPPVDVRVMKMGLGSGTITSNPAGINCGGDCTETITGPASLTLTATADAGSVFSHWEGDATGASNTVTISVSSTTSVRAVFNLATAIPTLTTFTPAGIQAYLTANPTVNTPARFVAALPVEFRQNWILMSRSESLQTGTAEFPRLLLPNATAQIVFTIGLVTHGSYPGSHPLAIEMMQWDATDKNFRFHEVVLDNIQAMGTVPARTRTVSVDDSKCSKCHSTNNVLNRSTFPGTTGVTPGSLGFKNKPNWDTYDSWGGMMPFNRDRIYQGSLEAAAFRKLFNPWTWAANEPVRAVMEQLELQPPGVPAGDAITRTIGGANDGHVNFAFDGGATVLTEPAPVGSAPSITTNYNFLGVAGSGAATTVVRGGTFLTLHHSATPTNVEGRGVQLFDLLGGADGNLNPQRITDELIKHRFATGSVPIDIRPIALAITNGLLTINAGSNTVQSAVGGSPLTVALAFFNSRNGMSINELVTDTRNRSFSIPRRKADLQKLNVNRTDDIYLTVGAPAVGMAQQYGAATAAGTDASLARVRQEVFRRPIDAGVGDRTFMGGIYVDRELESNIEKIALYRYFLEPLGMSVDKWSMGVRGRSRSYTFADVFSSYTSVFSSGLSASLTSNPVGGITNPGNSAQVIAAVNSTLGSLPGVNDVPKYTDIQRIFNKSCIECHGGLDYPPYVRFGTFLDLSEDEAPPAGTPAGVSPRLARSYEKAVAYTSGGLTSGIYERLTRTSEECNITNRELMPCGGPALSKADIETIRRWIVGSRPSTNGDPHLKTVNEVNYDFQAAGEFVLLRGEGLEVQARHKAVATDVPVGPNGHTGLTSCVSLNSAIAMKVGTQRISYQPNLNGEPDPSGLQLRIDGKLVRLTAAGIPLNQGGRIIQTSAQGGIQVDAPGGTALIITPGWWDHYKVWYLNFDSRHVRATEGLMGHIAPGNWLPALPDGKLLGPRPTSLSQRYHDLYEVFGNAWRVHDTTSLFDYAPGTSTKTFTLPSWPGDSVRNCVVPSDPRGTKPQQPIPQVEAEKICGSIKDGNRRSNCILDVMATGEAGFAKTYIEADKISNNTVPTAPVLKFPEDFKTGLAVPVKFEWDKSTDADGDTIGYKLVVWPVNDGPNNNNGTLIGGTPTFWKSRTGCTTLAGLAGLLLFLLLYFLGLRKRSGLMLLVLLLILLGIAAVYYYCGRDNGSSSGTGKTLTHEYTSLEPGKAYYWKVIADDGKGGTSESVIRRIEIK